MIIRKREHWFRMLFVWHGSVLPKLLPRLILLFILAVGVVYLHATRLFEIPLNPAPFTLFGIALALFLGFRNNASYDRFWEGRKLWGALLNDTRSLARQTLSFTNFGDGDKTAVGFVRLLISFTYTLKHQLRGTNATNDLKARLQESQFEIVANARFKPVVIMRLMAEWVQRLKSEGRIDTIQQAAIDQNLDKLSDIVGGCERIASTPIPYSYRVLLHRTVYIYCFLLPFGLVDSLSWFTPFIVTFIAYTFVALEAIADEIEDPFGTAPNDLALNEMCRMIEATLMEMAEEPLIGGAERVGIVVD